MTRVSVIGLDLAKNVFQAHGADAAGSPVFRKKLRRDQVLTFFAGQAPPWKHALELTIGTARSASSATR